MCCKVLEYQNIDIRCGYGKVIDKHHIAVTAADGSQSQLSTDKVLICVGSRRALPSGREYKGRVVAKFPENDPRFFTADSVILVAM